jgi:hypothetical protein
MPANLIMLSRDLASFRAELECAIRARGYHADYMPGLTAAVLTLLDELEAGRDLPASLAAMIAAQRETAASAHATETAQDQQREADTERRREEDHISITVECPYCGVRPGVPCRSLARYQGGRRESHKMRWRAARGIAEDINTPEYRALMAARARTAAAITGSA